MRDCVVRNAHEEPADDHRPEVRRQVGGQSSQEVDQMRQQHRRPPSKPSKKNIPKSYSNQLQRIFMKNKLSVKVWPGAIKARVKLFLL
jgi:hypothetical protein